MSIEDGLVLQDGLLALAAVDGLEVHHELHGVVHPPPVLAVVLLVDVVGHLPPGGLLLTTVEAPVWHFNRHSGNFGRFRDRLMDNLRVKFM